MEKFTIANIANTYGSDSLKEDVLARVIDPTEVVLNVAYTDYGGELLDRAMIEWMKENHPEDIVSEDTSWNGQNAYIFGEFAQTDPVELLNTNWDFEEFYMDLNHDLVTDALKGIMEQYDFGELTEAVELALNDALYGYGQPMPTYYDYYEDSVIKEAQKNLKDAEGIELNFEDYKI